jgi:pimeloyl-ACP methyl ester carboxylesterase
MERVTHGGRETAYRVVSNGDGPTMGYVHGSGGTHRVWANQYAPDGPGGSAVALDLSGHGGSDDCRASAPAETLSAYVEDVRAVAEATEAAVLVGNSLGGAVVLQGLLTGALDPHAVVLTGTGAKLRVAESLRTDLESAFEAAIQSLHGSEMLFQDPDDPNKDRSMAQMRAVGQRVTERDFLACHSFDVRDGLDEIDGPALAICGETDSLTPPAYHEYLATHIPQGEFVTIPEAAHLAMVERPDRWNDAVAGFLQDIE